MTGAPRLGSGAAPAADGDVPILSPARALAWSEARIDAAGFDRPSLALWLPEGVTVAVGLAQDPEREARVEALRRDGVGLVRRQSGGGAVLLYHGVLCWEAMAPCGWLDAACGGASGIRQAYEHLSRPIIEGLGRLGVTAFSAGVSDLSVEQPDGSIRKIAGTAQLRRRRAILVHGSLLATADIGVLGRYLAFPSATPAYRGQRDHHDFCLSVAGIPAAGGGEGLTARLAGAFRAAAADRGWECVSPAWGQPDPAMERLYAEKYLSPDWNWRRIRADGSATR